MKRFSGMILLVMLLLFVACSAALSYSPRDMAVDYAWEIYNYSWKTSEIIPRYHAEGQKAVTGTIKGIPYTYSNMVSFQVYKSLSDEDRETANPDSASMKYGMVCATLVTDCIRQAFTAENLPLLHTVMFHKERYSNRYTNLISSVSDAIFEYDHTRKQWEDIWKNISEAQANSGYPAYKKLQKGDYLNDWEHVILVVANDTSAKEITYIDQTSCWDSVANGMVGTHKGTYSYDRLSERCFVPMYVDYPDKMIVYIDDTPPAITTTSLPDAYIGEPYYAQIEATGTEPITYTYNATAQANGFLLDGSTGQCTTGIINGTPTNPQSYALPYTVNVKITATNSAGSVSKTFTINVKEKAIVPNITEVNFPVGYIGETYNGYFKATGTVPIIYSISSVGASNGLSCNPDTGEVTGIPNTVHTFTMKIEAWNPAGNVSKNVSINIERGIPIDSTHFPDAHFKQYIWSAFNTDGDDYLSDTEIANVKEINISGRNISDLTGIKYFTALERLFCQENNIQNLDVGGMENLSLIQAWDNGMTTLQISGCTSLSDLWIHTNNLMTILADNCPGLKRICMWTNTNLASLNLSGMASLEELWAAGCISLRKLNVKNNPNMKLLYVDKCSFLEEIYAYGSSSINSINLDGCNNLKTFERESNVSVPGNKPEITTASLPDGYVGEAYSARIMATSTHPITGYEISAIGRSNGLQCDPATGEITGKPTTERTFSMTLYVSNYVGIASKTFDVTIKTRAIAPFITTAKLPSAKFGEAYYAKLTATGTTPITWSSTDLPSWLKLNASTGELNGTPNEANGALFTITASHGNLSTSKTYNINVTVDKSTPGQNSPAEEKPVFKNFSIMMEGQIGVNFYTYLPEIKGVTYTPENCWVDFNIRGNTSHTPQPLDYKFSRVVNGLTIYGFRCYINAAQMADTITATLHYGNGQTITKDYSAKTYLDTALGMSGFTEIVTNLMIALKNYGHYIQPMLSKERDWIIGEKYLFMDAQTELTDDDISEAQKALKSYAFSKNLKGSGIAAINYSLTLGSETTINLYITPASGYSGNISAYLDRGTTNIAVINGDKYKVQISNIAAKDLGTLHTLRIIADAETTVKISALSYAEAILNVNASQIGKVDIQTMKKAATALYHYYRAAKAYADNQ